MNEFYSIAAENVQPENEFQLENLGPKRISAVFITPGRNTWEGYMPGSSNELYRDTTPEDYDDLFIQKLLDKKPIYDLDKIVSYHYSHYLTMHNDSLRFMNQMRYVIIPKVQKRSNGHVVSDLINTWIDKNEPNTMKSKHSVNLILGDVNAPSQFQINSDNSVQKQEVKYSPQDIKDLVDALGKDIKQLSVDQQRNFQYEMSRLTESLKNKKNIQSRLMTIAELIRDVGIGTFANLLASPAIELLKPYLETLYCNSRFRETTELIYIMLSRIEIRRARRPAKIPGVGRT